MDKAMVTCMLGVLIVPVLFQITETTSIAYTTTDSNFTTTQSITSTSVSATMSASISSSLSPEAECAQNNNNCDKCVKNDKCLYCYSNNTCKLYPHGKVLPSSSDCPLAEARWGVCWLNFEAMIISVSVIGGILVIALSCCLIYCCCCRNSGSKSQEREDRKYENQRKERKAKQDDRRAERKGRMDEIRKKYGLMKDDSPHQQF